MTKRVEAAAKAAAKDDAEPGWYLETERFRDAWRNRMEAAFVAADAVMFDGDAIERAALAMHSDLCACDRPDDENCIVYDDWRATVRRVIAALKNDPREPSPHKGSGVAWPS